ncbi:hypothetical protein LWX53_11250, partial [bacterium]|nr:hypothetical protein [bacterium]
GAAAAEGATLSGRLRQSAAASSPISGSLSVSGGAATSLSLGLAAQRGSASLRASVLLSLLYGDDAAAQWAALAASPGTADLILMAPAFDLSAAAPDAAVILSLGELALRWDSGAFAFAAGKTYANWGVGKAFSPADFFAEFDYSSGTPARRSKLIAGASWFPGATTRVDLVADPWAAAGAAAALRVYSTAFDTLAYAAALGFRAAAGSAPERLIGSAEASLDLPFASPYAEAALSLPMDGSGDFSWTIMAGATARLGDLAMLGEYRFDPGAADRHAIFAQASLPVDEWISLSAPILYYPDSGVFSASLAAAVSDVAGLDLGAALSASRSPASIWSAKLSLSALLSF